MGKKSPSCYLGACTVYVYSDGFIVSSRAFSIEGANDTGGSKRCRPVGGVNNISNKGRGMASRLLDVILERADA